MNSCSPQSQKTTTRPNIILYLADDQLVNDYGCYGNPHVATSGVDRLAREGMRFDRAYTVQSICAPSRAALYTANAPLRNGCYMNHTPVRSGPQAVFTHLQQQGYEVVLVGKSHVEPAEAFPWDHHFESETVPVDDGGQAERLPLARVKQYLKETTQPYCLVLASSLPHTPYPQLPPLPESKVQHRPHHHPKSEGWLKNQTGYYENIRRDNEQLEQVLAMLDQSGQTANTLFIYTADHGSTGKFTVYESGLKIPLVIRWPENISATSQSDSLVCMTDIFPTLIDIVTGAAPEGVDGISFADTLLTGQPGTRAYTYGVAEYQNIWIPRVAPSRMVSDGRWKYIQNINAWERHEQNFGASEAVNAFIRLGAAKDKSIPYEELYDVSTDPYEQNNLAQAPEHSAVLQKLSQELERWMLAQNDYLADKGPLPVFETTHTRLDTANHLYQPPSELIDTLTPADYQSR